MENTSFDFNNLEKKVEEIYVLLKAIQNNQQNELTTIQKNHVVNMKRMNKLQEYNQIADMTNQIFEIRISGIEETLKKINNVLIKN